MTENPYELVQELELTEDLQLLANICGIDAVRKILEHYHGMSFYVPKLSRLDGFVEQYIKNNRHKSIKDIAKTLSLSEQLIRNKINGK